MAEPPSPERPTAGATPAVPRRSRRESAGRLEGLLCAALGMGVALAFLSALVGISGAAAVLRTWSPPLAAAAATLLAVVAIAAPLAARRIRCRGSRVAGPALALVAFVLASVAGASAARVVYGPGPHAVGGILLPVFWVVVFGGVPALLFGVLFEALVRRRRDASAASRTRLPTSPGSAASKGETGRPACGERWDGSKESDAS